MRWMLSAKSRSCSLPGPGVRRNSSWSYSRSAWKCSSSRIRHSSRSTVYSAPSRPYSRTAARKWPRAVASRTVFCESARSTSAGSGRTAAMSGDREHLEVTQRGHGVRREVVLGELRVGHQRVAQLVGEHLVLEVHRRLQPVFRDRVDRRHARGEALALARPDRLERVHGLLAEERVARIDLAAEIAHLAPPV